MKFKKSISLLVICIFVLSLTASSFGVFSNQGPGKYEFKSLHGKTVSIYGKGLYRNDSVSAATQGIAQDIVTMVLGIPLLIISLYLSRKGLLKGRLLLTGTIAYFLYTYTLYTFFAMFNPMFLIYVALISVSFFAFILTIMSFEIQKLSSYFNEKLPVNFIGWFLIFSAATFGALWLGRIVPPLINGTMPFGLEHYTTLVVQGMDLGFLIPTIMVAAVLLMKRKPFGYLLAPVMIIKLITLMTALTAMVIGQVLAGEKVGLMAIMLVPLINLVAIYCLVLIMKNIKESGFRGNRTSMV